MSTIPMNSNSLPMLSPIKPLSLSPTPYSNSQTNLNSRRSPTPTSTSNSNLNNNFLINNNNNSNSSSLNNNNNNNNRSKSPSNSSLKESIKDKSILNENLNNRKGSHSSELELKTKESPTLTTVGIIGSGEGRISPNKNRKLEPINTNSNLNSIASTSTNPLEDLIRTESLYVQDLGVIIKRVAAAWSRTNFPPPALDAMFRAVEAVYRVNKGLLAKLNEIGPNPASPKALGDLLMRWITEIEPSYNRYSTTYQSDFDFFDAVQSNLALNPILLSLNWPDTLPLKPNQNNQNNNNNNLENSTFPAPPSTSTLNSNSPTLDDLFQLPIIRLKYYKKLYSKLLKSTQSGRSDHDLLVNANIKLDSLLVKCEIAKSRSVAMDSIVSNSNGKGKGRSSNAGLVIGEEEVLVGGISKIKIKSERNSAESTGVVESSGSSDRLSGTSVPSIGTTLSGTPRVEDLEKRLCTDRALDIFTMLPKKCKLQMAPPNLNFQRHIRKSADVVISFQPLSDTIQRETIIRRAYIFLLTDLFLVCERMTPEEKTSMSTSTSTSTSTEGGVGGVVEGPDMWLMYPPLAGKHLRVVDGVYEAELEVTVMMKEKLIIKMESIEQAQIWKNCFEECISFGSNQGGQGLRSPTFSQSNFRNGSNSPSSQFPNGSPILGDFREELRSPGPFDSQNGFDSNNNNNNNLGYGRAPPSRSGSRAFSNGSINPPPRKQSTGSLLVNDYPGGRSLSNSSSSTSLNNGNGNGNYPLQNDEYGNSFISNQQPDFTYFQSPNNSNLNLPSNGTYNNNNNQSNPNFNNGFGLQLNPLPNPPHSAALQRSGSSISSSSGPSPGYSDPPPLPNSNNNNKQFRFDQRGMSTSRRTDPGTSDLLSPGGSSSGYSSHQNSIHRSRSADGGALRQGFQNNGNGNGGGGNHYRLPSQTFLAFDGPNSAPVSTYGDSRNSHNNRNGGGGGGIGDGYDDSPPPSPMDKQPEVTSIVAQMRCKAFLQQNHGQWKALGTAKVKLFSSMPSGTKQLVVESDKSDKKVFVSTIVLTDGVERVGKTGVAIELSDRGSRTGIVYMLQMKTEQATTGLYEQLLLGSGRKAR